MHNRPPRDGHTGSPEDPLATAQGDMRIPRGERASLSELSKQGSSSVWSKAIDADVARTFGRPTSFRGGEYGSDARQYSRRRHWWPESLGGAPLGAMTPLRQVCVCVSVCMRAGVPFSEGRTDHFCSDPLTDLVVAMCSCTGIRIPMLCNRFCRALRMLCSSMGLPSLHSFFHTISPSAGFACGDVSTRRLHEDARIAHGALVDEVHSLYRSHFLACPRFRLPACMRTGHAGSVL